MILFVDQGPLYRSFDWNVPIFSPTNLMPRETRLAIFLCPTDGFSPSHFVEMGPTPERYAMASFVASFGPPDLDADQEQRFGMFSRNSRTRFADVTDGLSQTLMAGERMNGPFRNGGAHANHFSYETTWAGAVRDWNEPDDDHGHMVLFQTGHVPNHVLSDDRDVSAPHIGYANFCWAMAPCAPLLRTSTSCSIRNSALAPVAKRQASSDCDKKLFQIHAPIGRSPCSDSVGVGAGAPTYGYLKQPLSAGDDIPDVRATNRPACAGWSRASNAINGRVGSVRLRVARDPRRSFSRPGFGICGHHSD